MSKYEFYIYKIDSNPNAKGVYIGPFASEEERDREALRLRRAERRSRGSRRAYFRANIDADIVGEVTAPSKAAA